MGQCLGGLVVFGVRIWGVFGVYLGGFVSPSHVCVPKKITG
jgi:hypothetical protein